MAYVTNEKFRRTVISPMIEKNGWDIALNTQRQASKFRNKRGTVYGMWRLLPRKGRKKVEVGNE